MRAIVENVLLDTMFEVPSKKGIKAVRVFKEVITEDKKPEITYLSKDEIEKETAALAIVPAKEKKA